MESIRLSEQPIVLEQQVTSQQLPEITHMLKCLQGHPEQFKQYLEFITKTQAKNKGKT